MRRVWQLVWFRYALLLTFLAAGTLPFIWYRSPKRGLPYHDQFVDGELKEWQQFGGNWTIDGDTIRNESNERGAKLVTGSPFWANYEAEADVQLLGASCLQTGGGCWGDVGILIRASDVANGVDSYRGYYAGLRLQDQALVLGRADYGWYDLPPIPMPGGIKPNRWYHLTISAYGCNIHASAIALDTGESANSASIDPNCLGSGKIGLRAYLSGGIWRRVEVHALNRASAFSSSPISYARNYGLEKIGSREPDLSRPSSEIAPIDSIRLLAASRPVHVIVRGTVTLVAPHTYIQDETGGAQVAFGQQTALKTGDAIEVAGDAHREGLTVQIENATERSITGDVPVPALSITPLQAAIGQYDGMFVELEGKVDSTLRTDKSIVQLHLSGAQQEFSAISNTSQTATLFSKVEAGSQVRLRGICVVSSAYTNDKVPFALIVPSPDDVEVVSGPPWWSGEHLALMAIGMLGLGFLIHRLYSHAAQRRQLRDVINTIPGYVWSYMPDGQVDFVNDRLLEFMGLSLQDTLGENWNRGIHPDDESRVFAIRETARKKGQAWECEFRVRRADGEYLWWFARTVPLRNRHGSVIKWYGNGVEIDDRKRAEQALRRSEAYLAEAQGLSRTGSWAWNLRTGELSWSQEVFRIFEIDPETNATWSRASWSRFLDSVHPEDRARIEQRAKMESTEKDWAVSDIEFRIVVSGGTIKHVHGISYRVADDAGGTAEVMGTIVDVTESKRAEQERERIRQLETDLAHMNRVSMLGELAASLAHELNQPITGAVTSARACLNWLAHNPPGLERARAAAARIENDGTRAAEIINRLRAFYKKGAPPQREVVDVSEIVREMFVLLHNQLDPQTIKVVTLFAADVPKVLVDRVQLQQVFMNLMLNAIDAMKDTGGELTIRLQTEGDHVLVSVTDTGVGLPPDNTSQIFNAFYTTKSQGTGMGLAISRSIIEAHAGRLWASTNGTRGATFHFTLPADVRG
jgi:PAS domain S-box-containing protein